MGAKSEGGEPYGRPPNAIFLACAEPAQGDKRWSRRPVAQDRRGAARAAAARAASRYAGAGWQGSDAYEGRGSHVADHRRDDSRGRDEGHRWGYAAPGRAAPLRAHYAGRSRSRSRWSPRGSQVSGYLSGQLAFRQGGYQQRARALPAPPPPPPQRRPEEELSVHSSGSYSSEASGGHGYCMKGRKQS